MGLTELFADRGARGVDTPEDRLAARVAAEYDRFVLSMSYARTGETPSFEAALESLGRLALLMVDPN